MNDPKVALFIPIKLNNQRLPGKNIKPLNGVPLCKYLFGTVATDKLKCDKYVFCSDESIKEYMPREITFLKRDKSLDSNSVKGLEIIEKFVEAVDADVYILTHVTQPFTKIESIVRGLEEVLSGTHDSSFSAVKKQDYFWCRGKPLNYDPGDIVRTQDLDPLYMETGGFFIFKKEVFTEMHRRIGINPYICEVDDIEAIDIDTAEDFKFAELVAKSLILENNR